MSSDRYLIVGLGNPGPKYANTRHNIGYALVDALADRFGLNLIHDSRLSAQLARGSHRDVSVGLAKPLTYMNRSGHSVARLLDAHDIPLGRMLIVYDDLNLKLGAIRLRPSGSSGGHNGIQSVIDAVGSNEFARLRLGIGDDYAPGRQSDYVLSPFTPDELPTVRDTIETAEEACIAFLTDGLESAMSRYNRRSG